MSFSRIRAKMHRAKEYKTARNYSDGDDQFFDISGDDFNFPSHGTPGVDSLNSEAHQEASISKESQQRGSFTSEQEKSIFEEQLNTLQEQLVATVIENQTLSEQLKLYRDSDSNRNLRRELETLKQHNRQLEEQLRKRDNETGLRRRRGYNIEPEQRLNNLNERNAPVPVERIDSTRPRGRLETLWDLGQETAYNMIYEISELTQPLKESETPEQPLKVKTLKENVQRFKSALKPYTDTLKGLHNVLMWQSRSYTFIVFCVFMFSCFHGYFLSLMFLMAAIRMGVSWLHLRGSTFKFDYFPPGEEIQGSADELGLSDKFNLVIQVATKVQNGLGTAADGLEKIKNLLSWKHSVGSRKLFTMLCVGCVTTAVIPTSILWKFIGLGLGVKLFIVNFVYNKYPRMKRRWDSNYRLWQTLPTNAQYERQFVKAEMDRYIVVSQDEVGEGREIGHVALDDCSEDSSSSDSDTSDNEEFRLLFSLPVSESPVHGWSRGKRSVLVGRERNLFSLLSRKRGKLYLTKSFLCFERDKSPSVRNIVIPLVDITSVSKIKINQRMPGRGMAIQLVLNSDGKENVLNFGGIIGRDWIVKCIGDFVRTAKRDLLSSDAVSRRSVSMESSSSRITNFTFGAYYEDSE